jgi:hypothetical protein
LPFHIISFHCYSIPYFGAFGDELAPAVTDLVEASAPLDDLDGAFARFLRLDVANGDASVDTVRGYRQQATQAAT